MKRSYEQQSGAPAQAPGPGQPGFKPLYPPAQPPAVAYAASNPAYMQAYAAAYAQAAQGNPYAMYAQAVAASAMPQQPAQPAPAPPANSSAPATPTVAGPLHPAFANYGYGPQHPSHQQVAQVQASMALTGPSPYPMAAPFPQQPFPQTSPPSKRPRYDSGAPPIPSPLQPPPPPPLLRPVVDPSRPPAPAPPRGVGPGPGPGRQPLPPRPRLPPPYNGPTPHNGPYNGPGGPGPGFNGPGPRPYDMPPSPMSQAMPMAGPSRYSGPPPRRDGPPMRNGPPPRDGPRAGPPPGGSSYRPGPPLNGSRGGPSYRGGRRGGPRERPQSGPRRRDRGSGSDDKRRTFSDFRIVGIEIAELKWSWEADGTVSREPSMAPPDDEAYQGAKGKHARETDSEDDYEAETTSKRVKAEREASVEPATAAKDEGDVLVRIIEPSSPVVESVGSVETKGDSVAAASNSDGAASIPAAEPDAPKDDATQYKLPLTTSGDTAAESTTIADLEPSEDVDGEDIDGAAIDDGLPFAGEPARPPSPTPSQTSTIGKRSQSRATSVVKSVGSRLRIYFASSQTGDKRSARPSRRPPIPSRPIEIAEPVAPVGEGSASKPEQADELAKPDGQTDAPADQTETAKAVDGEAAEPDAEKVDAPPNDTAAKRARSPSPAPDVSAPTEPSADRVSISYARNTRRIIVDASAVSEVRLHRGEYRIELDVRIEDEVEPKSKAPRRDPHHRICRGVFIEAIDPDADDFVTLDLSALRNAWDERDATSTGEGDDSSEDAHDELLPPLHRLSIAQDKSPAEPVDAAAPRKLTMTVQLDRANPLQEARWARSGEVDEWIAQNTSSGASEAGWQGKIKVVDPDPPPTFQHALDTWIDACTLAPKEDLRRFAATHMQQPGNVIEVLLRIVRGDARIDRSYHIAPPPQPPAVAKLARQLDAPYPTHQTHVSLATLQLYKLAVDQSGPEGSEGRRAMEKRIGEVVRALPYHLVFRVLDAMAREVLRL